MEKRNFLPDINIWGAMLVARCGNILHYSIPCLLKYCDKVLLMQDNIDQKTKKIVEDYKKKYPNIIELSETGFPPATPEQEKQHRGLFHRFKPLQGPLRQKVFDYIKGKEVDILIFPDSDELFTDNLPNLLKKFWSMPEIKGVTCKAIDVFGDFYTVHNHGMTGHTRILKPFKELSAIPYRTACYYNGLDKMNRIGDNRTLVHLASFNAEKRSWRSEHWKPNCQGSEALWKLPKDVRKMKPEEIKKVLKRPPDLSVEEYLRGGDKRIPMGVENAEKAISEAYELLQSLGVRLFLAFGTCLFLTRDNCIASKYDWDLDTVCLAEDIKKIDDNVDKLLRAGFIDFKRKQDIPKWKRRGGFKSEEKYVRTYSFKKYGCRIDIDPLYLSANGKERYCLKGRKREMFVGAYPREMFDSPKTVRFKGIDYRVPNPPEKYNYLNYGDTWDKPIYGPMSWHKRPCYKEFYECK